MSAPARPPAPRRVLADADATAALGAAIAGMLRRGDVVALVGDLGAGKTTLVRGLLAALGHAGEVPSPTFTLVQTYPVAPAPVWHFDLYRLADPVEIVELGFDEARAEGICVIEWPEILGDALPAGRLDVVLDFHADGAARTARLVGHGDWPARLRAAGFDDG